MPRYFILSVNFNDDDPRSNAAQGLFQRGPTRITTDLDTLKCKSNALITSLHISSIFCKSDTVCANRIMSSAYKMQPTNKPWSRQPQPLNSSFLITPSMYTANNSGDKIPPWRTPAQIWKTRENPLFHLTIALHLPYRHTNTLTRQKGTARSKSLLNNIKWFTLSKAFEMSNAAMLMVVCCLLK